MTLLKLSRILINKIIRENEFEVISDKKSILAEQTKKWVIYTSIGMILQCKHEGT